MLMQSHVASRRLVSISSQSPGLKEAHQCAPNPRHFADGELTSSALTKKATYLFAMR